MNTLVLGGTGFIGRRLVARLLAQGCTVTVATTGRTETPFGDMVGDVRMNRFDTSSMKQSLPRDAHYDILFDQLCYDGGDAGRIVEVLADRIDRYVFVSSAAVYHDMENEGRRNVDHSEEDFDALSYAVQKGNMNELGYAGGKRSAEAYFFQNAPFPVAAARLTSVVGFDDSTLRFQRCVRAVLAGEIVVIPPGGGRRNLLWVEDAGRFLAWLGLNGKAGAYNAASESGVEAADIAVMIGDALGRRPHVERSASEGRPFYFASFDSTLSVRKAEREGFHFTPLETWLPAEARAATGAGVQTRDYMTDIVNQKGRVDTQ